MKTISEKYNTSLNDHDVISNLIDPQFLIIAQILIDEKNYALAPANMAVYQIIECLKKLNLPIPIVYDDQPKEFNATIVDIEGLQMVDTIFVIAYSQKERICQKLFSIYGRNISIIPVAPPEEYIQNNQWSFEDIKKLSVCESSFEDIKEKHLLFVFDTHFSDVPYKVDMIADILDAKVFWIGASPHCLNDKVTVIDNIDFFTMLAYYRGKKKITIFSTAVYSGYIFANFIKKLHPEKLKVILYIYDYLPHICSFTYAKTLSNYLKLDFKQLTSEYYYAYKIIEENIVDALIFKDGDASFEPLFKTKTPSLCFPAFPDKKTFSMQKIDLPKAIDDLRFLHIGTILSRENEPESIYGNNFYDEFFEEIVKYQMQLDMYYMTESSEKVAFSYSQKLGSKKNVNFIKIGSINNETERFSKYHYGVIPFISNENVLATSLHATSIPSKFFTYLSLGLPIITHRGFNTISELVEKYELGLVIENFHNINFDALVQRYEELKTNVVNYRKQIALCEKEDIFASFIKHIVNTNKEQLNYIENAKSFILKSKKGYKKSDLVLGKGIYISSDKVTSFSEAQFLCDILLKYPKIAYIQIFPSIEFDILVEKHQLYSQIKKQLHINPKEIVTKVFSFFFFGYSDFYQQCKKNKFDYFIPSIIDGDIRITIADFFNDLDIIKMCNILFINKEESLSGYELFKEVYQFNDKDTKDLYCVKDETLFSYYMKIFDLCVEKVEYKKRFAYVTQRIDEYYLCQNEIQKSKIDKKILQAFN